MSNNPTDQTLTGGCQCGAVRYGLRSPPLQVYVCHCSECRKQSASAFGISAIVRSRDLQLLHGQPKHWSRLADSGKTIDCFFCPDCGSRLWHGHKERSETVSVKGGSLDTPPDLATATHIWTDSKLDGTTIPEHAPRFRGEPR